MLRNPWVRLVLVLGLIVGILWILAILKEILTSFALGFALAYFLNPGVNFMERVLGALFRRVPVLFRHARSMAIGVLAVGLVAAIVLFFLVAVPAAIDQVKATANRFPQWADTVRSKVTPFFQNLSFEHPEEFEMVRQRLIEEIRQHLPNLVKPVGSFVGHIFSSVLGVVLFFVHIIVIPVFAFYLMSDMNEIKAHSSELVPPRHREWVTTRVREIDKLLSAFVRGQLLVCLVMGIFYGVALTMCGLPMGLLVGFGTSFFSLVPYMSTAVGLPIVVVLSLLDQHSGAAALRVAAVYVLGHIIEGHFITPRLMSGRLGLHPVVILLAILVWGTLLGFVGVLIAVPVTAALSVFWGDLRHVYVRSRFYGGERT